MNTKVETRTTLRNVTVLVLFVLLAAGAAFAETAAEQRSSATSQGQNIQRGALTKGAITFDEHDALNTSGNRQKQGRGAAQQKASGSAVQSVNTDFWFYNATVDLFSDLDGDGYYFGIDLQFDADTIYTVADVYAVIYLSYELGPWNEYAETETFAILGASGTDAYTVETELVSGYPTGDYDILIELFDAYDDSFVASFGPDDSSQLAILPLEDAGRDTPQNTQVVINSGGGGSFGWFAVFGLLGLALRRLA